MAAFRFKVVKRGKIIGEATTYDEAAKAATKERGRVVEIIEPRINPTGRRGNPAAITKAALIAAAKKARAVDLGLPLTGRGHGPRCTSAYSAQLSEAGVRSERIASGGVPSRAFPLEVVREIERTTGVRLVGKVSGKATKNRNPPLEPHSVATLLADTPARRGNPPAEYGNQDLPLSEFAKAFFQVVREERPQSFRRDWGEMVRMLQDGTVTDYALWRSASPEQLQKIREKSPAAAEEMVAFQPIPRKNPPLEPHSAAKGLTGGQYLLWLTAYGNAMTTRGVDKRQAMQSVRQFTADAIAGQPIRVTDDVKLAWSAVHFDGQPTPAALRAGARAAMKPLIESEKTRNPPLEPHSAATLLADTPARRGNPVGGHGAAGTWHQISERIATLSDRDPAVAGAAFHKAAAAEQHKRAVLMVQAMGQFQPARSTEDEREAQAENARLARAALQPGGPRTELERFAAQRAAGNLFAVYGGKSKRLANELADQVLAIASGGRREDARVASAQAFAELMRSDVARHTNGRARKKKLSNPSAIQIDKAGLDAYAAKLAELTGTTVERTRLTDQEARIELAFRDPRGPHSGVLTISVSHQPHMGDRVNAMVFPSLMLSAPFAESVLQQFLRSSALHQKTDFFHDEQHFYSLQSAIELFLRHLARETPEFEVLLDRNLLRGKTAKIKGREVKKVGSALYSVDGSKPLQPAEAVAALRGPAGTSASSRDGRGFALTAADKRVITAFADQRRGESRHLRSDGRSLSGNWVGGSGLAFWELNGSGSTHEQIVMPDGDSKTETVQRYLRHIAPTFVAMTRAEAEAAGKKLGGKVLQEMGKTSNPGAASGERVGDIILRQLGGTNRLKAMLNANNFLIHPDGLEFSFSGPEPQKRGNNVLIRLEPGDTYSAGFIYIPKTSRHWATAIPSRPIHKYTGIYADQLMPLLERHSGLTLTTSGADLAKLPAPAAAMARPLAGRASNPPLEHSNAAILLDTVKPGKPQVIHGVKVSRVGAGYSIDRVVLSRELAIKRLEAGGTANPAAPKEVFWVDLSIGPNPDRNETWPVRRDGKLVGSVAAAIAAARAKLTELRAAGHGASNWYGGKIHRDRPTGEVVAHVSYNGRAWEGDSWPAREIADEPGKHTNPPRGVQGRSNVRFYPRDRRSNAQRVADQLAFAAWQHGLQRDAIMQRFDALPAAEQANRARVALTVIDQFGREQNVPRDWSQLFRDAGTHIATDAEAAKVFDSLTIRDQFAQLHDRYLRDEAALRLFVTVAAADFDAGKELGRRVLAVLGAPRSRR